MKRILLVLLFFPFVGFGQSYVIDEYSLEMFGSTNNSDVSVNTYYNSFDTCSISWSIITDSLPSQWEFSICFPDCYIVGVVDGQDLFLANEQAYLNCHMYPNGQAGTGIIQMEIITNNTYRDTVTWTGFISSVSIVDEQIPDKNIYKVIDILGRETNGKSNDPLFYIYDDGTVEKRIVIE
tara:strand:- start:326 stop:865 length:540 start_codon:yes stop_codon:yes gene_type:complete